jgi:hypothetical protein
VLHWKYNFYGDGTSSLRGVENCALLKETAMDFLVKNSADALDTISYHDLFTPTLIRDVFAAVARGKTTSGTDGNGGKCRYNSCELVNCVGRLMRRG